MLELSGFLMLAEKFKKPGVIGGRTQNNFDHFDLCFESTGKECYQEILSVIPTDTVNHYRVRVFHEPDGDLIRALFKRHGLYVHLMVVDFSSRRDDVPAPHSRLLALHPTCARVL